MSERSKARHALLELQNSLPDDYLFSEAERRIMDTQFEDMGPDNYVRVGKLRALRDQAQGMRESIDRLYEEF